MKMKILKYDNKILLRDSKKKANGLIITNLFPDGCEEESLHARMEEEKNEEFPGKSENHNT